MGLYFHQIMSKKSNIVLINHIIPYSNWIERISLIGPYATELLGVKVAFLVIFISNFSVFLHLWVRKKEKKMKKWIYLFTVLIIPWGSTSIKIWSISRFKYPSFTRKSHFLVSVGTHKVVFFDFHGCIFSGPHVRFGPYFAIIYMIICISYIQSFSTRVQQLWKL
jgi:hypothetical protein